MHAITLKMPEPLAIRLEDAARKKGVSKSALIRVLWRCTRKPIEPNEPNLRCRRWPTLQASCPVPKTCLPIKSTCGISVGESLIEGVKVLGVSCQVLLNVGQLSRR